MAKKNILTNNRTGSNIYNNQPLNATPLNGSVTINTIPYPIYGNGTTLTNLTYNSSEGETMEYAINIVKLSEYPEYQRTMLEKLLFEYLNKNYSKIIFDTLENYGVLCNLEALERKTKIENLNL